MTLLLLAAAGIALWGWRAGHLRAMRFGDVAAGVAALVGISLLRHGTTPVALIALGGAGLWAWARRRRGDPEPVVPVGAAAARALLDVPPHADAAAIRAAHRRLIARVHPDAGGTTELAHRVNEARDILLARLRGGERSDAAAGIPRRS